MNESFKYLIAKNDTTEEKWLPLWVHCIDTFHVMQYLISHWLNNGALHGVAKKITSKQIQQTALFLSVFHDFGKTSLTFQVKIANGVQELHQILNGAGFHTPDINDPELRDSKKMPHGIAGEILLLIKGCPPSIAAVVGAHHGQPWETGPEIAGDIEEIIEEDKEGIYRNFC